MTALAVSAVVGCNHAGNGQGTSEPKRIAEACLAMLRSLLTNETDIAICEVSLQIG